MLTSPLLRRRFNPGSCKPLTLVIHMAIVSTASVLSPAYAQAQSSMAVQTYDIPAGPLSSAINRFAQQAGVAIIVPSNTLQNLTTPGLHGTYSEQGGFEALLRGTGSIHCLWPAHWN